MRLCRFDDDRLGVVDADSVRDVTAVLAELPTAGLHPLADPLFAGLAALRPRIEALAAQAAPKPLSAVRLLSPAGRPSKIVAAPVNYINHLNEVNESADLHHGNLINEIHNAGVFPPTW